MTRLATALLVMSSLLCSCGVSAERDSAAGPQAPKGADPSGEKKPSPPVDQASQRPRAAIDPAKFALIISGPGGEDLYSKKFAAQAMQLFDALTTRLGFDDKHVHVLTESAGGGPENGARGNFARSTAEEVKKAFASFKAAMTADSFLLVVLIGHGSFDNQQAKFNLLGPDLSAKDYAQLLGSLPSRRIVFVNTASASGEFIKPLSGENRIVITATKSGAEQNLTIFAEHLIAALTDAAADADKNNRISVLEAFNFATRSVADWYKQKDRLASEHALLDDNGDGTGHDDAKEGDGVLAKTTYFDSRQLEQAGGDGELAKLLGERQKLEEAIEKLKSRKSEMKQDDYDNELERLLVELASVGQRIKERQK